MTPNRPLAYDETSRKRKRTEERRMAKQRLRKRQEDSKDRETTQVDLQLSKLTKLSK